jgi:hypothetical protein
MKQLWKHPDLNGSQATLLGKTMEQEADEQSLHETIEEATSELQTIKHIKTCHQCQMELCLSIERYLGTRGPWWINIEDDGILEYEDALDDRPTVKKYKVGKSVEHTLKFLIDRMAWAQNKIESEMKENQTQLKQLKSTKAF